MNNIGIIGTGRLGLSFALLCAKKGYKVYAHDKRQEYIDSLSNRTYTTIEPHIEQYLRETDVEYTTKLSRVVQECDILFCFVATPSLPDGSYDHSAIEEVMQSLENIQGFWSLHGKTLVIGCTTMPGYTNSLKDRADKIGMSIAYNPEFIAQGDIINGLKKADMILLGVNDERTTMGLTAIYRTIMDKEPVINSMSPTAAEITKISINCFLTTKISFANMIGEVAINSGIEQEIPTILQAIGADSRIGHKFLGYGYGFSGVCLPRDNRALGVHAASVHANSIIPNSIDTFNRAHHSYLKDYYITRNPDKSVPFIFSYISYKKGTDILTESAPYKLCKDLLQLGYRVHIEQDTEAITTIVKNELPYYLDKITWGIYTNGYKIEI